MMTAFDQERWAKIRWENLAAARRCRATLTNPTGSWRYGDKDERVIAAVKFWVDRAWSAHAIAMGRKPVTDSFSLVKDGQIVKSGPIYARPITNPATLIAIGKLE